VRSGEKDELYTEVAGAGAAAASARAAAKVAPMTAVPNADPMASGARHITGDMDRNRGLTPHRRKDLKNPRKKHRIKYGAALVKRSGAVQAVKAPTERYGGEGTGIKSRVVKSRAIG
jgi:U3 small nucleolar RNA-associated protein 3